MDAQKHLVDIRFTGLDSIETSGMICLAHSQMLKNVIEKRGPIYEIPFRTLYGNEIKNLIVAGRCISVTDAMWDITRVIPACAVTGEAAGTVASMTDHFANLDVVRLQIELQRKGVKLEV